MLCSAVLSGRSALRNSGAWPDIILKRVVIRLIVLIFNFSILVSTYNVLIGVYRGSPVITRRASFGLDLTFDYQSDSIHPKLQNHTQRLVEYIVVDILATHPCLVYISISSILQSFYCRRYHFIDLGTPFCIAEKCNSQMLDFVHKCNIGILECKIRVFGFGY